MTPSNKASSHINLLEEQSFVFSIKQVAPWRPLQVTDLRFLIEVVDHDLTKIGTKQQKISSLKGVVYLIHSLPTGLRIKKSTHLNQAISEINISAEIFQYALILPTRIFYG